MENDLEILKKFCEERGIRIVFEEDALFNDGMLYDIENKLIAISGKVSENDMKNLIEYIKNNCNI